MATGETWGFLSLSEAGDAQQLHKLAQPATRCRADVGPTSALKSGRRRHYNVSLTSFCPAQHRPNVGVTLAQPSANVGATLVQPLGDVGPTFFCQHFTNLLGNFLPTFGRPFTNLYLLILSYNVHQVRHNF